MTIWTDTFAGRTVASDWGTASNGQVWSYAQNNINLSVGSGKGQYSGNNSGQVMINILGSNTGTDMESLVRWQIGNTGDTICTFLRITDSTHYYRFSWDNASPLRFGKKTGGGFSQIAIAGSPITISINTLYWFHFRVVGANLYGRVWADGSAEPGVWHITAVDTGLTSGGVGIGFNPVSAVSTTITVDSFSANTLLSQNTFGKRAFGRIR